MPQNPFSPSTSGSTHFKWGHKEDFFENHYSTYLFGNGALIAPIIVSKFLLNYHVFFLETIGMNSLKSFCTHI
jgi:hypothetical protein